jgi:PTS system fructose-specific IIC component
MKITDLLKKDGVSLNESPADQNAAIDIMVALHDKVGNLNDKAEFKKAIEAREAKGSTAVGMGIAVPHAKTAAVNQPGLVAITVPSGVDYKSLDKQPSKLFFMIAAPDGAADTHLEVLSKLMTMLMDQKFSNSLIEAKTPDEFLKLIDEQEAAKDNKAAASTSAPAAKSASYIVGVTACPTGIAHTYMAAEALEQAAANQGVSIKVETDGSGGAKNVLTAEEIKKVEEIVNNEIAADLTVDTKVMSLEEAKKTGAMALFGEKYGDSVRVVNMGGF